MPGGVDKGLSACNVRLRARRPTSLLYRRLCGEQLGTHRRKRAAFLATSAGAATAAKDADQAFFEIQLEVGAQAGSAGFGSTDGRRTMSSSAATLAKC